MVRSTSSAARFESRVRSATNASVLASFSLSARTAILFSVRWSDSGRRNISQLAPTVRIASRPSGSKSKTAAAARTAAVNNRDRFGSIEGRSGPPGRELPVGSFTHRQALESTERMKNMMPPSAQRTVSNALAVSSISAARAAPHARFSSGQCRTAHPSAHRANRAVAGLACLATLMPRVSPVSRNAAPVPHESPLAPTRAQFQIACKGVVVAVRPFWPLPSESLAIAAFQAA